MPSVETGRVGGPRQICALPRLPPWMSTCKYLMGWPRMGQPKVCHESPHRHDDWWQPWMPGFGREPNVGKQRHSICLLDARPWFLYIPSRATPSLQFQTQPSLTYPPTRPRLNTESSTLQIRAMAHRLRAWLRRHFAPPDGPHLPPPDGPHLPPHDIPQVAPRGVWPCPRHGSLDLAPQDDPHQRPATTPPPYQDTAWAYRYSVDPVSWPYSVFNHIPFFNVPPRDPNIPVPHEVADVARWIATIAASAPPDQVVVVAANCADVVATLAFENVAYACAQA
jgi:hypothetical protein